MQLINGKPLADKKQSHIAKKVEKLNQEKNIAPVPSGFGSMTITMLLSNTLKATKYRR